MISQTRKTAYLKGIVLLVFAVFVAHPVFAAPANRALIAPAYERLQSIAEDRGQVRVIVQVSDTQEDGLNRQDRINNALGKLRSGLAKVGIQPVKEYRKLPLMVFSVTEEQLDELLDSGLAVSVVEDGIRKPALAGSTPYIGGDVAHGLGLNGNGATVAILDSGVDTSHYMFGGRVVEEACFSTRSVPNGSYSLCPNGTSNGQYGAGSAAPCNTSIATCDHGTHVASIAAGYSGHSVGMAPQASIIAIQVFSRFTTAVTCGSGVSECIAAYDSDVVDALEYVATLASSYTIGAVNMSIAGGQFTAACNALPHKAAADALVTLGIAVVASSGNDGFTNALSGPACVSSIYSVGAMWDGDGSIQSFSNSAAFLDMVAPGRAIGAALPNGGFGGKSGTSMAAPFVAGAFTVLKADDPSLTVAQMQTLLESNAVPLLDSRNGLTFPRLDLGLVATALTGIPGDINTDGVVDAGDLLLMQRAVVGELVLTAAQLQRADLHPAGGDGDADISDLLALQALVVAP